MFKSITYSFDHFFSQFADKINGEYRKITNSYYPL